MVHESRGQSVEQSVLVAGGGLAGLTTSVALARRGFNVTLWEAASAFGGRAQTREKNGFHFNLGPRALYVSGEGRAILDRLGVRYQGQKAPLQGAMALVDGHVAPLPLGLWSLMTCSWMSLRERLEMMAFLGRLPRLDPKMYRGQSAAEWILQTMKGTQSRLFLGSLLRLTTYCAEFTHLSAESAVRQLKIGFSGSVLYLDEGWQTLVDELARLARESGVRIETDRKVHRLDSRPGSVVCEDREGLTLNTSAVVLALNPREAARLIGASNLDDVRALRECRPVYAACLDVGLHRLPRPGLTFAQGIDCPYYFSVHSAAAELAPDQGALIHVLRYLQEGEEFSRSKIREELEALLDRLQPGWREVLKHQQFLPRMVVSYDLPSPKRDPVNHRLTDQVYLAGDWVGSGALLADAAILSGFRVAQSIEQNKAKPSTTSRVA